MAEAAGLGAELGAALRVELHGCSGAFALEAAFATTRPWTVLFGPSGSGKTTVLKAVAGLLRPAQGRIVAGEETLLDVAAGIDVPAHLRQMPLAPQSASLFPHLSVGENILYGLRRRRKGVAYRLDGARRLGVALEAFELSRLAERSARELSGGEAQRVNLARAWIAGGRMLLLDEPFNGLDRPQQSRILSFLREDCLRSGRPVLSVTHDVAETFALAAEVIRLAQGRVVAQGPVETVLAEEREGMLRLLGGV